MPFLLPRSFLLPVFALVAAWSTTALAHVVPNTTVEADFAADGTYTLRINLDPRTFLAEDPATLPPVPASWYRDQTPAQVAATQEKARAYLARAISFIFNGDLKHPLPECSIQPINGENNTPLGEDTKEVHLLATAKGVQPPGATVVRLDYSRHATTTMVLLVSQPGKSEPRAIVVFPGELSKEVALSRPVVAPRPAPPSAQSMNAVAVSQSSHSVWFKVVLGVIFVCLIIGWRLLAYYRHHHRMHRRPGQN